MQQASRIHDTNFLSSHEKDPYLGLIILDADMQMDLIKNLWNTASQTFCTDKSITQIYQNPKLRDVCIPSYIIGEQEMVKDEVLKYYTSKHNTAFVSTVDLHHNRLMTCLERLHHNLEGKHGTETAAEFRAVVIGAMGKRLDQEMQNLNALYYFAPRFHEVILTSTDSLCLMLQKGIHQIHPNMKLETKVCGLIPLGGPCGKVRTEGLKWDLKDETMQFGGLISTSNVMQSTKITVENSEPLLWTTVLEEVME